MNQDNFRVTINYRAFQDLFGATQAMREQSASQIADWSLIQFNEDLAGIEGILLTCMALEATTFELMSTVVKILSHISTSPISDNDSEIYALPAKLAEEILADIPVPVFVTDTRIENTADGILAEEHRLEKEFLMFANWYIVDGIKSPENTKAYIRSKMMAQDMSSYILRGMDGEA